MALFEYDETKTPTENALLFAKRLGEAGGLPKLEEGKEGEGVDPNLAFLGLPGQFGAAGVGTTPKPKPYTPITLEQQNIRATAKEMIAKWGEDIVGTEDDLVKILTKQEAGKDISKTLNAKKVQEFNFGKWAKKNHLYQKVISGVTTGSVMALGADMMITWMLNDNIPFLARSGAEQIAWKFRNGDIDTYEDAMKAYDNFAEYENSMQLAQTKVDNLWNPFNKGYREEYKANLDMTDAAINEFKVEVSEHIFRLKEKEALEMAGEQVPFDLLNKQEQQTERDESATRWSGSGEGIGQGGFVKDQKPIDTDPVKKGKGSSPIPGAARGQEYRPPAPRQKKGVGFGKL